MEWKFCGDGSETVWGRVGRDIKSVGMGGDKCTGNFCPVQASIPQTTVELHDKAHNEY